MIHFANKMKVVHLVVPFYLSYLNSASLHSDCKGLCVKTISYYGSAKYEKASNFSEVGSFRIHKKALFRITSIHYSVSKS